MHKPVPKYFFIYFWKIALFCISVILSTGILLVGLDFYLNVSGINKKSYFADWTLDYTKYSPRYIYWGLSHCELFPGECRSSEEQILTHQVEIISSPSSKQIGNCQKILFLGDSFTDAPWTQVEDSYPHQFSEEYSRREGTCIRQYRLATGGTGSDQQYARFIDIVDKINPDIVIWQFWGNDLYENVSHALYKLENNYLIKRSSILNTTFIAGWLNQKIPFLKGTTLGKHLMYLGAERDIFRYWETDYRNIESVISYNNQKLPLLITEMKRLSEAHNFNFYTTLAPLECQLVSNQDCRWVSQTQNALRSILQKNSHYVSMELLSANNSNVLGASAQVAEMDFPLFNDNQDKNPLGQRHLSPQGNLYFGTILFQNFISR